MSKKHEWIPTDNQGQSMECERCGVSIGIQNTKEWNEELQADCLKSR